MFYHFSSVPLIQSNQILSRKCVRRNISTPQTLVFLDTREKSSCNVFCTLYLKTFIPADVIQTVPCQIVLTCPYLKISIQSYSKLSNTIKAPLEILKRRIQNDHTCTQDVFHIHLTILQNLKNESDIRKSGQEVLGWYGGRIKHGQLCICVLYLKG